MNEILNGIIVGGVGGAAAGIMLAVISWVSTKCLERADKTRIYNWLKAHTSDESGKQYRSTRAIASWTNLTEDRVRYICSIHNLIYLSTGEKEDMWGLSVRRKQ